MIKKLSLFIVMLFLTLLTSCNLFIGERFKDRNLQGTIINETYTYGYGGCLSHYSYNTNKHTVILYPSSEESIMPNINFWLEKGSEIGKHKINENTELFGYITPIKSIKFYNGEIEIFTFNENEIKGRLWGESKDGNSSVNGNFVIDRGLTQ